MISVFMAIDSFPYYCYLNLIYFYQMYHQFVIITFITINIICEKSYLYDRLLKNLQFVIVKPLTVDVLRAVITASE